MPICFEAQFTGHAQIQGAGIVARPTNRGDGLIDRQSRDPGPVFEQADLGGHAGQPLQDLLDAA